MAALAADRNLLFGLLALQNGLINQVQLVAAFQAWTLDKARALADHLIALGHLNPSQRAAVEVMAELHVAKHGDVERSLAAIPAGRSTHENLARLGDPDIEGTLAQVRSRSTQQDGEADVDRTATYSVGTATSDGLRFRVLRPHARGGLSSWANMGRPWWWTGAWPRRPASPTPRVTSGLCGRLRPLAVPRRCRAAPWARRPT
jgi:hypothetical protein